MYENRISIWDWIGVNNHIVARTNTVLWMINEGIPAYFRMRNLRESKTRILFSGTHFKSFRVSLFPEPTSDSELSRKIVAAQ